MPAHKRLSPPQKQMNVSYSSDVPSFWPFSTHQRTTITSPLPDIESMEPLDEKIDILGGSSDHIILDVTKSDREYQVGDVVQFVVGYGGMLKTATSPYVEKTYR